MPPDPRVHVGVSAFVWHDDHLLMMRRSGIGQFASDGYNTWALPGGWLDFGETPEEAVEREVLEETGIIVTADARLGYSSGLSEDGQFQIVDLPIRCRWIKGVPRIMEPEKCSEVAWVHRNDIEGLDLFHMLRKWIDQHQGILVG